MCGRDELIFPKPSNQAGKDGLALGVFASWFHTQTMKYGDAPQTALQLQINQYLQQSPAFMINIIFSNAWRRKSGFLHVSQFLSCSDRLLIPRAPPDFLTPAQP